MTTRRDLLKLGTLGVVGLALPAQAMLDPHWTFEGRTGTFSGGKRSPGFQRLAYYFDSEWCHAEQWELGRPDLTTFKVGDVFRTLEFPDEYLLITDRENSDVHAEPWDPPKNASFRGSSS